jgi:hypothetical protein
VGIVEPRGDPVQPDPVRIPSVFAKWLVAWLSTRSPSDLAGWAEADESMVEVLRRSIPGASMLMPTAVRGLMGREAVEQARLMEDREFLALVDEIANSLPEHATILWLYRDWYLREIRRVRDMIVGG